MNDKVIENLAYMVSGACIALVIALFSWQLGSEVLAQCQDQGVVKIQDVYYQCDMQPILKSK